MCASTAIRNVWTDGELKPFLHTSPGSILHAYNMSNTVAFQNSLGSHCIQKSCNFSIFKYHCTRLRSHHLWGASKGGTTTYWLCCLHVNASSDEDYRSSLNIAIILFKQYRNIIDCGGGDNLR